ncbi:hypothetical protein ABPG72_003010 [Tetrahymena utriculariae]
MDPDMHQQDELYQQQMFQQQQHQLQFNGEENIPQAHNMRQPSSSLKKSKNSLPQPEGDIEEYMEVLLEHQKNCERSGKYVEAEMAKRRLAELKVEFEKRSKTEMKQRHQCEKQEIEKAHLSEYNEFNEFWDRKMLEFNQEAERVERETVMRHQEELRKIQEELDQQISQKPKDTTELLNLRKTEEQLAKQQEYMEAHKIQQRIFQIEKEEFEKWNFQRNQKIRNIIQQMKQRQLNELNALRQRIQSGQEEQKKIRTQELEKLLQKYNNVKKELETTQVQEHSRMERSLKNGSVINASKIMNQSRISNASFAKASKNNQY